MRVELIHWWIFASAFFVVTASDYVVLYLKDGRSRDAYGSRIKPNRDRCIVNITAIKFTGKPLHVP